MDGLVFQRTLFTFSVRILIYIHDMKPLCHRLIDNIIILLDLYEVNDFLTLINPALFGPFNTQGGGGGQICSQAFS